MRVCETELDSRVDARDQLNRASRFPVKEQLRLRKAHPCTTAAQPGPARKKSHHLSRAPPIRTSKFPVASVTTRKLEFEFTSPPPPAPSLPTLSENHHSTHFQGKHPPKISIGPHPRPLPTNKQTIKLSVLTNRPPPGLARPIDARPRHPPRFPAAAGGRDRPPRLPDDARPALVPLPLPRGPAVQPALQPTHQGLQVRLLDVLCCWLHHADLDCWYVLSSPKLFLGVDYWLEGGKQYADMGLGCSLADLPSRQVNGSLLIWLDGG